MIINKWTITFKYISFTGMGTGEIKKRNKILYYSTEQGARIAFGKYRKKIGYDGLKTLILQECVL